MPTQTEKISNKNIKTKIIYFLYGMKFFAIFQSFREGGFAYSF